MALDKIRDRILRCADYYIENESTVRDTAKVFHISKTTVHVNLTDDLKRLDINRYNSVRKIMNKNKNERHFRGGYASKINNSKTPK